MWRVPEKPGRKLVVRLVTLALAVALVASACRVLADTPTPPPVDTPTPAASPTTLPSTPTPTPTPLPVPSQSDKGGVVDRIAYVGTDGNIYTINPDGTDKRQVTAPFFQGSVSLAPDVAALQTMFFNWPTWSPDASKIAFTGFTADTTMPGSLYVANKDGGRPTVIYENPPETAGRFVAVNSPHYIYWAPDSERIAFLAPSDFNLSLFVAKVTGSDEAETVIHGAPSYLAWSPDARYLLLHRGEDLILVDTLDDFRQSILPARSAAFRAPSWSFDGEQVAFIDRVAGGIGIKIANLNGSNERIISSLDVSGAFAWSPTEKLLAFAPMTRNVDLGAPTYNGLQVFNADTLDLRAITEEELVAFFWSPDGAQIAYAAVDRSRSVLSWHVADPFGNNDVKLADFIPSSDLFFVLFSFFDQYAHSNRLWSPDSSRLVYTGRMPGANGTGESNVFVLPADGSRGPTQIAKGTLAFWSPK